MDPYSLNVINRKYEKIPLLLPLMQRAIMAGEDPEILQPKMQKGLIDFNPCVKGIM